MLFGSFLTMSENSLELKAILPFSTTSPITMVSMPSSISLAINLMLLSTVLITIHSSIGKVVLVEIALITIFMLLIKSL